MMFSNPFLDKLPEYGILQNIVDKCDNENAISQLEQNVKSFVVVKKCLQQRQGQQLAVNDLIDETGINFDILWMIVFLIAFSQGFQSVSMNNQLIIYNG